MGNANLMEETGEPFILPSPVTLDTEDFPVKQALNMSLELEKNIFNIRLVFKTINPSKFTKIIDKTDIEFETSR